MGVKETVSVGYVQTNPVFRLLVLKADCFTSGKTKLLNLYKAKWSRVTQKLYISSYALVATSF